MQMKKFEARTMKEALEMVKTQLGPDAVILSAKEVTKGFGLGGEKSIEITAAYSESVLQQKKAVESKMPDYLKESFSKAPARMQKQTIQKALHAQVNALSQSAAPKAASKYSLSTQVQTSHQVKASQARTSATAGSYSAMPVTKKRYADIGEDESTISTQYNLTTQVQQKLTQEAQNQLIAQKNVKSKSNEEVQELKSEIEELKSLISQFKTMPQNFVQAHPGAELGVNYTLSSYFTFLQQKGLLPEVAAEILIQAQGQIPFEKQNLKQVIEGYISKYILKSVKLSQENFEKFHFFVGPSGTGKTASLVKYASHLSLHHHKRVALISTDTLKIGADEQMRIFSQILNLPFIAIRSQADWYKIFPYLDQVDHVLVDFASVNLKQQDEIDYIQQMMPPTHLISQYSYDVKTHLVLSATAKDADLFEVYRRYSQMNLSDVIFTSLDEAVIYGNIYNFSQKTQLPLFSFGIGPKTPEDFEMATAERVLDLIMNITQNQKAEMYL